jgi:hypothetical protein
VEGEGIRRAEALDQRVAVRVFHVDERQVGRLSGQDPLGFAQAVHCAHREEGVIEGQFDEPANERHLDQANGAPALSLIDWDRRADPFPGGTREMLGDPLAIGRAAWTAVCGREWFRMVPTVVVYFGPPRNCPR